MFTVFKYPKKCLEDLTTFSCLLDEDIPKIWKKLNSHDGIFSYLQNSTANLAHQAAHFCPVLVCPQKATVRILFLPYIWNPLIADMKNVVKSSKPFFWYFNALGTHTHSAKQKYQNIRKILYILAFYLITHNKIVKSHLPTSSFLPTQLQNL